MALFSKIRQAMSKKASPTGPTEGMASMASKMKGGMKKKEATPMKGKPMFNRRFIR